jgi:Haem-binding domain
MKKNVLAFFCVPGFLFFTFLLLSFQATTQEVSKTGSALPDSVNIIITASCTPCHTSEGGMMSRSKLNFTEWTNYSPEKQKERSAKIYSEINKGSMPPKMAREKRPESIPTKEQLEIIKRWSESFPSDTK